VTGYDYTSPRVAQTFERAGPLRSGSPHGSAESDTPLPAAAATVSSSILVVDDIEWNRLLIGTLLQSAGYTNLRFAADGVDAMTQIAEERPDLLVLDIMMPRMDGFEVCRRLRHDHATADLPILVQTALTGIDDRNQAFEAGTTDLICKPLDRAELLARVRIHLENRLLLRNLQQFRARVESELATARAVFTHLLPSQQTLAAIRDSHGLTIRFHMIQASALGGDIWGARVLDDHRLSFYLMDMPGRGVSAALNACRVHTLLQDLLDETAEPEDLLKELNERCRELLDPGSFVTVFSAIVDIETQTLRFAGAAFQNFLVYRPDEGARLVKVSGLPLGVLPEVQYPVLSETLPAGSVVVVLSNAVFDVLDQAAEEEDEALGLPNLLMESLSTVDRAASFERFRTTLSGWLKRPLEDDHTLIWLEVGP